MEVEDSHSVFPSAHLHCKDKNKTKSLKVLFSLESKEKRDANEVRLREPASNTNEPISSIFEKCVSEAGQNKTRGTRGIFLERVFSPAMRSV